jgi:hypothetical protein
MNRRPQKRSVSFQSNAKLAQSLWGSISKTTLIHLKELTRKHRLSIAAGDLQLLEGRWYVTHAGLLRIAERRRCAGIRTSIERHLSDSNLRRWVCKSIAYKKGADSRGFTGYGDADPSNVAAFVQGAELRVAETRAVNRALRKAYGIALCSVEELGSHSFSFEPNKQVEPAMSNGSSNGQPRLRDKLCFLIRRYELDPNLIKRYAADFCGTETLRDASRDLVEAFVSTVAKEAANDRAALVCKLNSYYQPEEARP